MTLTAQLAGALFVLLVLLVFMGIVLVNLAVLPTLHEVAPGKDEPSVAVLVPARNEEANIEACLRSLLAQDYPGLQVWLYDDASTDATLSIVRRVAAEHDGAPTLHIVEGDGVLPTGWLGKANACHRLYLAMRNEAAPEYMLFTDADVRFAPGAVGAAVTGAARLGAGLLSVFPRQITLSWAERLAVPVLLHWTVYNFLPLPLAFTLKAGPAFAAANGQFMLFTREAYEVCGGHTAVRSQILEDVALSRAVKRAGYPAWLADARGLVYTRMYSGAGEVWRGYSKNAYAFFGYSPFFLAVGVAVLLLLYVLPPVFVVWAWAAGDALLAWVFVAQYAVAALTRLALHLRFHYPLLDALAHPVGVLYMIAVQVNSMVWALTGRGSWKGRGVKG